jgi:hypothetical protein
MKKNNQKRYVQTKSKIEPERAMFASFKERNGIGDMVNADRNKRTASVVRRANRDLQIFRQALQQF